MLHARQDKPDLDERRVATLEFIAACAILTIIALMLYMVFSYRPS